MHKVDKFLARLDAKLRQKVLVVLECISHGDFTALDMRKLQGSSNVYRVRLGKVRIKFNITASGTRILSVEFRSEDTYRDI